MKQVFTLAAFFVALNLAFSQEETATIIGVGYSGASVSQPKFADLLVEVNDENIGLTKKFDEEGLSQGFNFFGAIGSRKTQIGFTYSRVGQKYRAEGLIPAISSNSAGYKITSRHTQVSGQFDFFLVKFFGIGLNGGYTYSTIRDERKDLIFGETNQVVDKKGGLHGGLHATLQIPLGKAVAFQLQPYFIQAFYKNDMDNIASIYLGQPNSAAKKTNLSMAGIHAKLAIRVQ